MKKLVLIHLIIAALICLFFIANMNVKREYTALSKSAQSKVMIVQK